MTGFPSFSVIVSGIFICYILHSLWTISQLLIPPKCVAESPCMKPYLAHVDKLQLLLFSSLKPHPQGTDDLIFIDHWKNMETNKPQTKIVEILLPKRTVRNGTLYIHAYLTEQSKFLTDWETVMSTQYMSYAGSIITQYHIPEAESFNLLGNKEQGDHPSSQHSVSHLRSQLVLNLMGDLLELPRTEIPAEFAHLISLVNKKEYLPIFQVDRLSFRLRDLVKINSTDTRANISVTFVPVSFGQMRLWLQLAASLENMHKFGFTEKDTDEVKGIFSDTNIYLLLVTFLVSAVHLMFDFLAFKNDVQFWRGRETMVGLSGRTIMWRCFSQVIIFLHLLEEETSLIVVGPVGIAAIIEAWKVTKVFRIRITWSRLVPSVSFGTASQAEKRTEEIDSQSMKYLSYLLYPLCMAGAVYSLIYMPHKSWYSWCIQSLVNGVYAFGFLFMLPQLFVNYKLKSVAHLPWRAFMYKAFNTFIDDLFAFIITMPTAHRLACFRDDVVFLIYLYQRWLYPVDKTRVDEFDTNPELKEKKKKEE